MLRQLLTKRFYLAAKLSRSKTAELKLVSTRLTLSQRLCTTSFRMSHLVFVYGTLKRGQPNHGFMTKPENGKATFVGEAKTVDKWPLVVATKFNIPFMLDKPGVGHNVFGELYEIDDEMLQTLDKLESYPILYGRQPIPCTLINSDDANHSKMASDGLSGVQNGMCYILLNFNKKLLDLTQIERYDSNGNSERKYIPKKERNMTADELKTYWAEEVLQQNQD